MVDGGGIIPPGSQTPSSLWPFDLADMPFFLTVNDAIAWRDLQGPRPQAYLGMPAPTGQTGGAPAAETCRVLNEIDLARIVFMNTTGSTPAQIADALGITEACLRQRAGDMIKNVDNTPIAGGAAKFSLDPGAAIAAAADSVKAGASQLAIALAVVGFAAVLIVMGARKELG